MDIKSVDTHLSINAAKQRQTRQDSPAVSFNELMRQRLGSEADNPVSNGSTELTALYGIDNISAVAARSRIQQDSKSDVSDFLELVSEKNYLLAGADLSGLNEASTGKSALSGEALTGLRAKYDTGNLSAQQQADLLCDLTNLNVLTKSDVQALNRTVAPSGGDLMGYLSAEAGYRDVSSISETDLKGRLEAMTQNERFAYDHVKNRYGKSCNAVNELADSHSRVLNVVSAL